MHRMVADTNDKVRQIYGLLVALLLIGALGAAILIASSL